MEIVDDAVMLAVAGALHAGPTSPLLWGALGFALAVAFVVTVPGNRWLIARGEGHPVVHRMHAGEHAASTPHASRSRSAGRPARTLMT